MKVCDHQLIDVLDYKGNLIVRVCLKCQDKYAPIEWYRTSHIDIEIDTAAIREAYEKGLAVGVS